MDEYNVAVYSEITDSYCTIKSVDNYYDGVIEVIATAKAKHCKVALIHDGKIAYMYDNR